jgi:hypothetical protein
MTFIRGHPSKSTQFISFRIKTGGGICEYGNDLSSSIKDGDFIDSLRESQLLKTLLSMEFVSIKDIYITAGYGEECSMYGTAQLIRL